MQGPHLRDSRPDGCDLIFFFNDTATTEIYTLSLHDALPISAGECRGGGCRRHRARALRRPDERLFSDRKSTRLNSSHMSISYAVFCLKKKNHNYFSAAWKLACRWIGPVAVILADALIALRIP